MARAVEREGRGEGVRFCDMARGEIAQIFRVGKFVRPAGGKGERPQSALDSVEQSPAPNAPVLGRATEGDSGWHLGVGIDLIR